MTYLVAERDANLRELARRGTPLHLVAITYGLPLERVLRIVGGA